MKRKSNSLERMRPKRLKDVLWKVVDGKGILLNLKDGAYYEANSLALAMWEYFDGQTSVSEISDRIAKKFPSNLNRIMKDLLAFVSTLKRRKLLKR